MFWSLAPPWGMGYYSRRITFSDYLELNQTLPPWHPWSKYTKSPGQRQTIHWGQNFDDNKKAFSFSPYVASFKMISSKFDFIHIFNDFIHICSTGTRAENKLLMSTESPYHLDHLLQVSNKSLWILVLYTFFNVFPHVYSPGAGADNPLWTKSWCQQKNLVILSICCKFKKNIFEVWF